MANYIETDHKLLMLLHEMFSSPNEKKTHEKKRQQKKATNIRQQEKGDF